MTPPPGLVAWELTRRCNLKCRHCRAAAAAEAPPGEFTFEEAKRLVDDIAAFAKPMLILTGGEPLVCEWLADIAAYAKGKGMRPVVGTNGTLLDAAAARRLKSAGVGRVAVSIDHADPAAHDAFRGVAGAFAAAMRGVRNARDAGLDVQINSTITRLNAGDLPALFDLAVGSGAVAFHPFLLVPAGRGSSLADAALSAEEQERALRWIADREAESPIEMKPTDAPQYMRITCGRGDCRGRPSRGCLAGTGFLFVGHRGEVKPCGYFDLALGDARRTPLREIWAGSEVLNDLRRPEKLKGKCGVCEHRGRCGGCRARAYAATGDYLAEEPLCPHVPDRVLLHELQKNFPLAKKPWSELGGRLGMTGAECLRRARGLVERGVVRRIGPTFSSRGLGLASALVAFKVESAFLDAVAAKAAAVEGVTHDYARDGEYNLWFTVAAEDAAALRRTVEALAGERGVVASMVLPAEKTYKAEAVFR